MIHLSIIPAASGDRLDQTLSGIFTEYSREQIKKWIRSGAILLNKQTVQPKAKVPSKASISITPTRELEESWEAENIPLNIVYEDDELLVINKPAGLVVHPGAGNFAHTLLNALIYHHPALRALPRAGIIHRIDKDTTGLLVIAKTLESYKELVDSLKAHSIEREYIAVVQGEMIAGGHVDAPIGRHRTHRTHMAVIRNGKPARTHYRVLERFRGYTSIRLTLETGRTHQIRVHMAHIHHPIVGDKTYGGRLTFPKGLCESDREAIRQFPRQALHAHQLRFQHPTNKTLIECSAPLPADMLKLIDLLQNIHDA